MQEEGAMTRTARMLKTIGNKLEMFNIYTNSFLEDGSSNTPSVKESYFDVHMSLLRFFARAIQFYRNEFHHSGLCKYIMSLRDYLKPNSPQVSDDSTVWQPLNSLFSSAKNEMDDAFFRVEKSTQLTRHASKVSEITQLQSLLSLSKSAPQETARLPCVMLPHVKSSRFFDRESVILQIEDFFNNPQSRHKFCSLALYGLGGIGKSSVAQRFAQKQLEEEKLDALFWIHGEKELSMKQSFTEIAMQLRLSEATPQHHDVNRGLVLNWLQRTCKLGVSLLMLS